MKKQITANITYPTGGVSCSKDSFAVTKSLALRINICSKITTHPKSAATLPASVNDDTITNGLTY